MGQRCRLLGCGKLKSRDDLPEIHFLRFIHKEKHRDKGLIVIRYYLALRGAENGVTVMVTPFFCVQG